MQGELHCRYKQQFFIFQSGPHIQLLLDNWFPAGQAAIPLEKTKLLNTDVITPPQITPLQLFNWHQAVGSVVSRAIIQNQISFSKIKCLLAAANWPRAARGMNVEVFRYKKAGLEHTMLIRFQAGPTPKSWDTQAFQTQNEEWNVHRKCHTIKGISSTLVALGPITLSFYNPRNKYFRAQNL